MPVTDQFYKDSARGRMAARREVAVAESWWSRLSIPMKAVVVAILLALAAAIISGVSAAMP